MNRPIQVKPADSESRTSKYLKLTNVFFCHSLESFSCVSVWYRLDQVLNVLAGLVLTNPISIFSSEYQEQHKIVRTTV